MTFFSVRKRRVTTWVLAGALALVGVSLKAPAPVAAAEVGDSTGELVVEMTAGNGASAIAQALDILGWHVVQSPGTPSTDSLGEVVLVKKSGASSSSLADAAAALSALDAVADVEENVLYGGAQSQEPTFVDFYTLASMPGQPALADVGLPAPTGTSGHAAVVVAVIDGGFDLGVEALEGRTEGGYDALNDDSDPEDAGNGVDDDSDGVTDRGVGHGTAVASLIAVAAPECVIVPIRAFDDEGRGTTFALASAVRAAIDAGAQVINVSGGTSNSSSILNNALQAASEADILVVASAGNDGSNAVTFPAAGTYAIAVTGVNEDGTRDENANVGSSVDVSAYSIDVVAPFPGMQDGYGHWYGTSFSCAAFTAAAARVLQQDEGSPLSTGIALLDAATAYASQSSPYDQMGAGILDASSLLDD